MTLFEALILGHLVGDFLLQNHWMADNKATRTLPRLVHCIVYSITVYAFSWLAGGISLIAVGIILLSHFIIDQRSFIHWWMAAINRTSGMPWLSIVYDQIFHLLILAGIVYFRF